MITITNNQLPLTLRTAWWCYSKNSNSHSHCPIRHMRLASIPRSTSAAVITSTYCSPFLPQMPRIFPVLPGSAYCSWWALREALPSRFPCCLPWACCWVADNPACWTRSGWCCWHRWLSLGWSCCPSNTEGGSWCGFGTSTCRWWSCWRVVGPFPADWRRLRMMWALVK